LPLIAADCMIIRLIGAFLIVTDAALSCKSIIETVENVSATATATATATPEQVGSRILLQARLVLRNKGMNQPPQHHSTTAPQHHQPQHHMMPSGPPMMMTGLHGFPPPPPPPPPPEPEEAQNGG
jgi:hypothetical protein